MKKFKKAIILIIICVLSFSLVACGSKTPTDVVNEYFNCVKEGDSKNASELVIGNSKTADGVDDYKKEFG